MIKHKGIKHNIINDAPFIGAIIIAPTCNKGCRDCINKHLKRDKVSIYKEPVKKIIYKIKNNPFDKGLILAGLEWTESSNDMKKLIEETLKEKLEVMLYTYLVEDKFKQKFPKLYKLPIWVKFGEYNKKFKNDNYFSYGVKLATTNQYIKKLKE